MSIFQLFPALLLASIVGALVGCLVSIEITRWRLSSIMPIPREQLQVDSINVTCKIQTDDGRIVMLGNISTTYDELSAELVEQWLEKRGLVMAPKGKDFTVKAPQ